MEKRTNLDVPTAHHAYAKRHGALQDPTTGTLYVLGDVPPELMEYIPREPRRRDFSKDITPGCPICASRMELRAYGVDITWKCTAYRCKGSRSVESVDAARPLPPPAADAPARPPDESAKALRDAQERVLQHLKPHVAGPHEARIWLRNARVGIQYRVPIELMRTEKGCDIVIDLIARTFGAPPTHGQAEEG